MKIHFAPWLLLALLAGNAFAYSMTITASIQPDGLVQIVQAIDPQGQSTIDLPLLDENALDLKIISDPSNVNIEPAPEGIRLENADQDANIQVSYSSAQLTNKLHGEWILDLNRLPAETTRFRVILPPHTRLMDFNPDSTVYFADPNLVVEWSVPRWPGRIIHLSYMQEQEPISEHPAGEMPVVPILFVIAVLVIMAILWLWIKRSSKSLPPANPVSLPLEGKSPVDGFTGGQKEILRTLTEKETKILEYLVREDGCTQKFLFQKTGFSKATLSRTLQSLNQKQIVQLVPDGYSNRVYLTDWFKGK